jgi:hypothetical protein
MAQRKMDSGFERKLVIEVPLRFQGLIRLIAVTAAPAFVLFLLIPAPLVLPVLSILSLVIACVAATYALFITPTVTRKAQRSGISFTYSLSPGSSPG